LCFCSLWFHSLALKYPCLFQCPEVFLLCLLKGFFKSYIYIFNLLWVDFHITWDTGLLSLVCMCISSFSQHNLLKRPSFFPMRITNTFVKNQLTIAFCSLPLVCILSLCQHHAVLIPTDLCLFWTHVVVMPPALFFWFELALAIYVFSGSLYILGLFFLVLWKMSLIFW
jgi:hypothetical protein